MQKWELHWTKTLVRIKKKKVRPRKQNFNSKISLWQVHFRGLILNTGRVKVDKDMELPRILKKRMWKFQWWARKNHVKFAKVLVSGIGNSNGHNKILWNFHGEASFCLEFPPCLDFFWNSLMASKSLINTWGEEGETLHKI